MNETENSKLMAAKMLNGRKKRATTVQGIMEWCGTVRRTGFAIDRLGAMPFGDSSGPLSRRDTTTIAQRFNAGTGQSCVAPVPKGRLIPSSAGRVPFRPALGRPFGTWGPMTAKPSVETLGYSRTSLRDNDRRAGQGNSRKALRLREHATTRAEEAGRRNGLRGGIISLFASFALFRGYFNSGF